MTQDELKQLVAAAAIDLLPHGEIIGVGTGSTVNFFIDALAGIKQHIRGAVSSSERSTQRLRAHGIAVYDLNDVGQIPVYVDGADEIDPSGAMIKGGGGALTREKIIAEAAERFICIVDQSKLVQTLGQFPLPVEVVPMARELVARKLRDIGGEPRERTGYLTDNGNLILDVHGCASPSRVNSRPVSTRFRAWSPWEFSRTAVPTPRSSARPPGWSGAISSDCVIVAAPGRVRPQRTSAGGGPDQNWNPLGALGLGGGSTGGCAGALAGLCAVSWRGADGGASGVGAGRT